MADTTDHFKVKQTSNKSFGLVFASLLFVLSLWPVFSGGDINLIFLTGSFILFFLSFLSSSIFRIPNFIWFKFGIYLGSVMGPIIMALIFFFAFLPIGLVLRMFNKDLLKMKIHKKESSYWQERLDKMQPMRKQF